MPITATVQQFAKLSGLGKTNIYALIKSGELRSVMIGGRRLIVLDSFHGMLPDCSQEAAADRPRPAQRIGREVG